MNDELKKREQLSALADGQLDGQEWSQAMDFAGQAEGRETWHMYHLVGDVLRSDEWARGAPASDFLAKLHQKMAEEPMPVRSAAPSELQPGVLQTVQPAANDPVFRWKMVAGLASLAAVAAIGWNALGHVRGDVGAPQLASIQATAPVQVVTAGNPEAQVMIRDPRLDELLAAHKQYSGTTALQMPAGFLRNANFDAPPRKTGP